MKFSRLLIILLFLFFTASRLTLLSQNLALTINSFNDTTKIIEINALKKITFSGINVILKYNNGVTELLAADKISTMTFTNLSAFNVNSVSSISIYPNPSYDVLFIKNCFLPLLSVSVFSITGQYVTNLKLTGNRLDIRDLKSGVYLLKIDNQTFKFTKK